MSYTRSSNNTIVSVTQECRHLLQECAGIEQDAQISHWAQNWLSEFNLWDANVGASTSTRKSLSVQLRDDPTATKVVVGCLSTLRTWVGIYYELAFTNIKLKDETPKRVTESSSFRPVLMRDRPMDERRKVARTPRKRPRPPPTEITTATPPSNFGSTGQNEVIVPTVGIVTAGHEMISLQETKDSVEQLMGILLKLGLSINQLYTRNRLSTADNTFSNQKEDYAEFKLELIANLRVRDIRSKITANQDGLEIQKQYFSQQASQQTDRFWKERDVLVCANARRRHRFELAKAHAAEADKTGRLASEDRGAGPTLNTASSRHRVTTDRFQAVAEEVPATFIMERTRPETTNTKGGETIIVPSNYTPSAHIPYIARVDLPAEAGTAITSNLDYPDGPELIEGSNMANCPYCCSMISRETAEGPRWFNDIEEEHMESHVAVCQVSKTPILTQCPICCIDEVSWNEKHGTEQLYMSKGEPSKEPWAPRASSTSPPPPPEDVRESVVLTKLDNLLIEEGGEERENEAEARKAERMAKLEQLDNPLIAQQEAQIVKDMAKEQDAKDASKATDQASRPAKKSFIDHIGTCMLEFSMRALPASPSGPDKQESSVAPVGDLSSMRSFSVDSAPLLKGLKSSGMHGELRVDKLGPQLVRTLDAWLTSLDSAVAPGDLALENPKTSKIPTGDDQPGAQHEGWACSLDNTFAKQVFAHLSRKGLMPLFSLERSFVICEICEELYRRLLFAAIGSATIRLEGLQTKAEAHVHGDEAVKIKRVGSTVTIGNQKLSIVRTNVDVLSETQIGFPVLPDLMSEAHMEFLRCWLHDCNVNHAGCHGFPNVLKFTPLWLIDVSGDIEDDVHLQGMDHTDQVEWLALSQLLGSPPHLKVDKVSHADYLAGVPLSQLPATFRDAVLITRCLRVRYLWIDALCTTWNTTQKTHRSLEIDKAISGAVCVIAAIRASGHHSGFLQTRKPREHIAISYGTQAPPPFYICEDIDNFAGHVLEAPLYKKEWTFQERALAKRTLYFTEHQTYWECGEGVRCETMTKMRSHPANLVGDPQFPNMLRKCGPVERVLLIQRLFVQFSQLSSSIRDDRRWAYRHWAFASLQVRLNHTLQAQGAYGVLEDKMTEGLLCRLLLWYRKYPKPPLSDEYRYSQLYYFPSWSWLTPGRGIEYVDIDITPGKIKWFQPLIEWSSAAIQGAHAHVALYQYSVPRKSKDECEFFFDDFENFDDLMNQDASPDAFGPYEVRRRQRFIDVEPDLGSMTLEAAQEQRSGLSSLPPPSSTLQSVLRGKCAILAMDSGLDPEEAKYWVILLEHFYHTAYTRIGVAILKGRFLSTSTESETGRIV
ncbi:hypothetical protein SVAN01_04273 [Stagonosporopsis vannaccii]|nr:hypothetical protein SVAN01_04273 [Stagonosporopsis vannaccii]